MPTTSAAAKDRPGAAKDRPGSATGRPLSARSAASSPRVSSPLNASATRRTSISRAASTPISPHPGSEAPEALSESLKHEMEQKEQLLLQLQNKEQILSNFTSENDRLTSALHAAETRMNELYAEQSRAEMELAQRIDIADKLRDQVRELEIEKRDLQRRYNEQTITFEAERQAIYDNEQHLKSRIQSLTQARKQAPSRTRNADAIDPHETEVLTSDEASPVDNLGQSAPPLQTESQEAEEEPAEMTALKLELSTLVTSHSSLQNTLSLLQAQLVDLKRVNRQVQEENESYLILLREKTLSGQFNVMRQVGTSSDDDDEMDDEYGDVGSLRSTGRSTLDRVDEEPLESSLEKELERSEMQDAESISSRDARTKHGRKRGASMSHSPSRHGETLGDLPITGPGLDLAAELGRAENKDILAESNGTERGKGKQSRKDLGDKRQTDHNTLPGADVDALRSEVKALKDANKALSLYASKIIDRIIAQEGFEHVLAIDYEKEPSTPSTATAPKPVTSLFSKLRPQSVIVGNSSSAFSDPKLNPPHTAVPKTPSSKTQRRSLSFDWKNFSIFNTEKKTEPQLRPLTLKPGVATVTNVRKLDNQEDEEDRKERERLNATMKLMGIQPSPSPPVIQKSATAPLQSSTANNRRYSWFGAKNTDDSESSSTSSLHHGLRSDTGFEGAIDLTQEALEQAEAQNSLAALDAHEKVLSAEISRGAGGGFTEVTQRIPGARRSRRSAGGSDSGSTVWSAGMSGAVDDDE